MKRTKKIKKQEETLPKNPSEAKQPAKLCGHCEARKVRCWCHLMSENDYCEQPDVRWDRNED